MTERNSTTDPLRALNAICPYYTMFPLEFPLRVLRDRAKKGQWVVDPFCGRGTTNFAARLLGLPSVGIDSSPVAVALTRAKLASARPGDVIRTARILLDGMPRSVEVPQGEFWERAYERSVLQKICWLRASLIADCGSDSRVLLRAILLGALHGPRTVSAASHLSNQCPRTFAPKPNYAIRFWRKRRMAAPKVDVIAAITNRARRYLQTRPNEVRSSIRLGDSRTNNAFGSHKFHWVVTSPPYFGMRTYVADQWLRNWFVGGPPEVPYTPPSREIAHTSAEIFADELRRVWSSVAKCATRDARMVVRFGGIADRNVDTVELLKSSLENSGWRLQTFVSAGDANAGRRQAAQFVHGGPAPKEEHDFYARIDN